MAAKDALGKDQFIEVHHMSQHLDPPHSIPVEGFKDRAEYEQAVKSGTHRDDRFWGLHATIFAGTGETTKDFAQRKSFRHTYRVPVSALEPTVMGDDDDWLHADSTINSALRNANVTQPEIFESVPASRMDVVRRGRVQPYRNYGEGPGSLSFIIPKENMESLGVEYLGRTALSEMSGDEEKDFGKPIYEHPAKKPKK